MSTPWPIDPEQGVIDELQGWYLTLAAQDGLVYTQALRTLVNFLYLQRDYLARRNGEGKHTSYDYHAELQVKAVAWAIQQLVVFLPEVVKAQPEPPKAPRQRSPRRPRGTVTKNVPSWNTEPQRNWTGPTLPPEGFAPTPSPKPTAKEKKTNN